MYGKVANKALNAIERNYGRYKNQMIVANLIFDYVDLIVGPEQAPEVTKQMCSLPSRETSEYLQSFSALRAKIRSIVRPANKDKSRN